MKKILAIVLALTLVVTVFAACGKKANNDTPLVVGYSNFSEKSLARPVKPVHTTALITPITDRLILRSQRMTTALLPMISIFVMILSSQTARS